MFLLSSVVFQFKFQLMKFEFSSQKNKGSDSFKQQNIIYNYLSFVKDFANMWYSKFLNNPFDQALKLHYYSSFSSSFFPSLPANLGCANTSFKVSYLFCQKWEKSFNIQGGQHGNQIGAKFWELVSTEHTLHFKRCGRVLGVANCGRLVSRANFDGLEARDHG